MSLLSAASACSCCQEATISRRLGATRRGRLHYSSEGHNRSFWVVSGSSKFRVHNSLETRSHLPSWTRRQDELRRLASRPLSTTRSVSKSNVSSYSKNSESSWYTEMLGIFVFAASTSAVLLSHWSSEQARLKPHVMDGEKFPRGGASEEPNGFMNTRQGEHTAPLIATSALYLDPRVAIIYPHERVAELTSGFREETNIGGGKDGDEGGKSKRVEPMGDITTPTSASQRRHDEPYDLSVRAIKGQRLTMEDTFFVGQGGRFVAVFDGHGGASVSSYLQQNLYHLATNALKRKRWEIDDIHPFSQKSSSGSDPTRTASIASHVAALRSAFNEAEEHVLKHEELNAQGSTAVAVWVHEEQDGTRTLVSANVGDSRAVLSRQGVAVDLTRDHKPNEEREMARIKRHGGTIEWDALAKVHRVETLSLSRAIGDAYAKPVVSGEVDIQLFPVVEGKDEFLILASDGLWDVMSSQDVVSYVKRRFESELARKELTTQEDIDNYRLVLRRNMARSIVREAVRRGTGDNVCVLMVWLNDDNFLTTSSSQLRTNTTEGTN